MNKYLKKMLSCVLTLMLLIFSQSCNSTSDVEHLPSYNYEYDLYNTTKCDDYMNVDGELKEEEYNNQQYMKYITPAKIEVNVTTLFSDTGVYVAYLVNDSFVFYNKDYEMDVNTSVELFIANENEKQLSSNVLQIRVDAKNQRRYTYFKAISGAKVLGNGVNTGQSDGMSVEIYIPWSELGLKSKPEKIKIMPGYNHITSYGADVTTNWARPTGNYNNPLTYYYFNEKGYINMDLDDSIVGDSATGISKSNGWDLSEIQNGVARTCVNNAQMIFFKNAIGNNYEIETTVYPIAALDDPYPKAGLMVGLNDTSRSAFLIDLRPDYLSQNRVSVKVIDFFSVWNATEIVYTTNDLKFADGINLKVIKNQKTFYYYVNDVLCFINEIDYLDGEAMPGLFTIGMDAKFSNMNYKNYDSSLADLNTIIDEDANQIKLEKTIGGLLESSIPSTIKNLSSSMISNQNVTISLQPSIGYYLSKAIITRNGVEEDWLQYLSKNLNFGKIDIVVNSKTNIAVEFKKISDSNELKTEVSGSVQCEETSIRPSNAEVLIVGKNNKTLFYKPVLRYVSTTKSATFTISLIDDEYIVRIMLNNHITQTLDIIVENGKYEIPNIILKKRNDLGNPVSINDHNTNKKQSLISTNTWDFSNEESNLITTLGTGNIYFNSKLTNKYTISTYIQNAISSNGVDLKAGIIAAAYVEDGEVIRYCVMLDQRANTKKSYVAICKITSTSMVWTNHTYIESINITGNGNKLTVIRNAENFKVLVDNNKVLDINIQNENESLSFDAATGLQTIGTQATFKDYKYENN